MAYCEQADLLDRIHEDELIQLTDDDDAGAVDADVVAEAIADADAEIDGYCGKRYTVPFTTVPALVKKYSRDIAIYNLYQRRLGAPEQRRRDYDNAIAFLKNVAKGLASLGEDDPDGTPTQTDRPQITSNTRVFSRGNMSGW